MVFLAPAFSNAEGGISDWRVNICMLHLQYQIVTLDWLTRSGFLGLEFGKRLVSLGVGFGQCLLRGRFDPFAVFAN